MNGVEISESDFAYNCKCVTYSAGYPFKHKGNHFICVERNHLTLDEKKVLSSYNEITDKFYKALQISKTHKSLILADISHKQVMLGNLVQIKISVNIVE